MTTPLNGKRAGPYIRRIFLKDRLGLQAEAVFVCGFWRRILVISFRKRKNTEGQEGVGSKTGNFRNRPSLMLIASGKPHAPRMEAVLQEAGFRVESCKPKTLSIKSKTPRSGRAGHSPKRPRTVDVELEGIPLSQLQHDLQNRPQTISAMLKACAGLSPAVQSAGLAFYDPVHDACIRYKCFGPSADRVPKHLPWNRYPLLRIAYENKRAVYVSDSSALPALSPWNGRNCGGCLAFPLLGKEPVGVLFLSHKRAEPLDAPQYSILISLARAMETALENAILYSRLAVSETRYRSILFAAPFLIGLLDSRGTVLEINPKAVKELRRQGIPARRALGMNLLKFPGIPDEVRQLISEALRTGQAVSREKISVLLPRGVEVFRVHAFPLRGGNPASRELLVIAEIITHYQQFMDDAERTERLAAIGRVAASLAHEINNPLQALRSHLELIRSYPLSEEEREQSFRILEREVERLDETTRRVLGFARPAPDILQPVSVTGLLEQALALSRNYLRTERVEILTDFPEGLPPVLAAAGQLIQVFLNIILNAVHAMKGDGRLAIRVRAMGGLAEIAFANNGPPIPSENLTRIFDPFFTTRAEGTGLGLSISHAILQRHNGTIRAANLPRRRGVEFVITLPFAPSAS
jgi:signal transduction histidine kinase